MEPAPILTGIDEEEISYSLPGPAERSALQRRSFKILTISQLGGASSFMSTDNLIGLSYYLQHNPEEVPDMLIMLGGVLPEIPEMASKIKKYKLLSLKDGIQNLDDAAAKMKPHVERLFRALPSSSKIVYTLGTSDANNIDDLFLKLQLAYYFEPLAIEDFLFETLDGQETREAILRNCVDSLQQMVKTLAKNPDNESLLKEAENLRIKMRINSEEMGEFEERAKHLAKLYELAESGMSQKELQSLKARRETQSNTIDERIKVAEPGSKELTNLQNEAKKVANSLRKIEKRLKDTSFQQIAETVQERTKAVRRFSKTVATPPEVAKEIYAVAVSYYMSTLKDTFGRKRNIGLQTEGLKVYRMKDNSFQTNVLVGRSLGQQSSSLTSRSNTLPSVVLNRVLENSDGYAKYKLESVPINVLITGHHAYSSSALELMKGESKSLLLTAEQGPFWRSNGQKGVSTEWNKGTKIEEAKAVAKMLIDVSARMIVIGRDASITIDSLKERLLQQERARSDIEEGQTVKKMLSSVVKDKTPEGSGALEEKEGLEVAVVKSRRPSELRPRDAAWLTKDMLMEMVPYMDKPEPPPLKRYRFAVVSDTHIAGHGRIDLMKAAAEDIISRNPDFIVFNGDIVEGNRGNGIGFASVIGPSNDPEVMVYNPHAPVVLNVDSQPLMFIQIFGKAIYETITRGGSVVLVSGNHPNNTEADEAHDEAIRLRNTVITYLSLAAERGELPDGWKSRIKAISGSETGTDTLTVEDEDHIFNVMFTHRFPATKAGMVSALEKRKSSASVVFVGDLHSAQSVETLNHAVIRVPSMQDSSQDSYVRNINVPSSIRSINGYVLADVYMTKDEYGKSRPARYVTETVLDSNLVAKGLLKSNSGYERALAEEKTIRLKSVQRKEPETAQALVKAR